MSVLDSGATKLVKVMAILRLDVKCKYVKGKLYIYKSYMHVDQEIEVTSPDVTSRSLNKY